MEIYIYIILSILIIGTIICYNYTSLWNCNEKFIQIAHAGGKYKNKLYTNSLDSIKYNYSKGFRYFEIDINYRDSKIWVIHDFNRINKNIPSFKSIVDFVEQNPSYFILDIKNEFSKSLNIIEDRIKDKNLKDNFIPQVYCIEDIIDCHKEGFKTILIANWKKNPTKTEILEIVNYCTLNKIKILGTSVWSKFTTNYTNSKEYYTLYKNLNIPIFIHGGIDNPEAIDYAKSNNFGVFSQTEFTK